MSSMRTSVYDCRCPWVFWWCLRRRSLKIFTLSPRPWPSTVALTSAPEMSGAPSLTLSPLPTRSTWSNDTAAPTSAASDSTRSLPPDSTRYCLPPDLITAYIGVMGVNLGVAPQKAENYTGNHDLPVHAGAGRGRHAAPRPPDWRAARVGCAAGTQGGAIHRRGRRQAFAPRALAACLRGARLSR